MMNSKALVPLTDWGFGWGPDILIAGPCSAETPEQVMETVTGLTPCKPDMIRAGIWKPRTRPNSFEGVGSPGLRWLKDAGNAVGKPVCVEVANVKHVYEALRTGVEVLWIGARTTVNPFAVQEIADALEGVDIPVMVKNPVNPDLELWIGALERLQRAGINRLAAIHRGFSSYGKSKYRNHPQWDIAIELRRRIPELPMICDPSHISGVRELIPGVSQKALDLDFDGLMIESHIHPDKALSDAKQQLTPNDLYHLLQNLVWRESETKDPDYLNHLEHLREQIDEIDSQLIEMIAERMKVVVKIGEYKKRNNITILQTNRWKELMEERISWAQQKGLGEDTISEILRNIHQESIRWQARVMNPDEEANDRVTSDHSAEV